MNKFLEIFNVVTVIVLVLCAVGAIEVVQGDLTYKAYLDSIWEIVSATALARGIASAHRVKVNGNG